VALEAGGERAVTILAAAMSRHGRRRHRAALLRGEGAYAPDEGVAVLVRHLDVREEDVRKLPLDRGEGLGRRGRTGDDGALLGQEEPPPLVRPATFAVATAASRVKGSVTVKVAPLPEPALAAVTVP